MFNDKKSAPRMSIHDDPPLYVSVPPPEHRSMHALHTTEPSRRTVRPLPRPPLGLDPAQRTLPMLQRRASGGMFIHVENPPPKKKQPTFYVCNPSDSPISPDTPRFPRSPRHSSSLRSPPINIIPPSPLSPQTPGLVHTPQSARSQTTLITPTSPSFLDAKPPSPKHRRRFGKSVESIPQSVLADLRRTPEGKGPRRTNTLPLSFAQSRSDNDGLSSEDEGEVDEADPEAYTFVVETATRVGVGNRHSLEWDDCGDRWVRWVGNHNSAILRAL
ncbi:hypothetical protein C8R45DRAFT_1087359 [Mycena sanguinolenta]|nr:hypothetical protein C8R45DRAFT_1087359 [Mycena sanguinolenta]